MNLNFHLILCGVLAVVVIALFVYRRWLENHDDPYIHLHNDAHDSSIITSQTSMAKRLDTIDKVKNGLLAAVILYALAIVAMGIYIAWNSNAAL
jgi:membrane protein implicated in regulation of membrane protease activity